MNWCEVLPHGPHGYTDIHDPAMFERLQEFKCGMFSRKPKAGSCWVHLFWVTWSQHSWSVADPLLMRFLVGNRLQFLSSVLLQTCSQDFLTPSRTKVLGLIYFCMIFMMYHYTSSPALLADSCVIRLHLLMYWGSDKTKSPASLKRLGDEARRTWVLADQLFDTFDVAVLGMFNHVYIFGSWHPLTPPLRHPSNCRKFQTPTLRQSSRISFQSSIWNMLEVINDYATCCERMLCIVQACRSVSDFDEEREGESAGILTFVHYHWNSCDSIEWIACCIAGQARDERFWVPNCFPSGRHGIKLKKLKGNIISYSSSKPKRVAMLMLSNVHGVKRGPRCCVQLCKGLASQSRDSTFAPRLQ